MTKKKPKPKPKSVTPTYEEAFFKVLKAAEVYFGGNEILPNTPEEKLVEAYAEYLNNLNRQTIQTTGEPL